MTTEIITIGMDDKLKIVQELFERFHFHHLLVVHKDWTLAGVVSDRDLLKALSPFTGTLSERSQDVATLDRRVHQIMSRSPIVASRDRAVDEAAVMMLSNNISCLPIVRPDDTVEGIVTLKDILKWLVKQALQPEP
jgi:acetoin utilization protein AcuB